MTENNRSIPVENVRTFIEALKKEGITTFNYPIWKEKFLSVLEGIDTQIFSVADDRREKKQEIIARMQALREQGMTEQNPGFDVASQLLDIMPGYEKELHLRGAEIEVSMTMFAVSANIIETMRGLGISENIVKEQQKFLTDEWDRMQNVFTKYIGEVMSNHKEQTSVQITNANELSKKLLEHIEHRDTLLKEVITKGIVTKEDIKDMMSKSTVKHVYEQQPQNSQVQQPTQEQQQRFNQVLEHNTNMHKVQIYPNQEQQTHQADERETQKPISVTSEKEDKLPDPPIPRAEERELPRPVTATEIYKLQDKINDDNIPSNMIKKKEDIDDIKENGVFNNVNTHSDILESKETQKQDDAIKNTEQINKPTKDLSVKGDKISEFIENAKQSMVIKTNIKQVKDGRMYYRWTFKKKFNRKTVPDELEKVFEDRLNELEQLNV